MDPYLQILIREVGGILQHVLQVQMVQLVCIRQQFDAYWYEGESLDAEEDSVDVDDVERFNEQNHYVDVNHNTHQHYDQDEPKPGFKM